MQLDAATLLAANGAVVTVSAVAFILNTMLVRGDAAGRAWSVAFLAGILTTVCYAVWGFAASAWWAVAIGNGALVMSIAMMWSGCRLCNGRRPVGWVALLAGAAASASALAAGPDGGAWAGAIAMFLALALFSALAGFETVRGTLGVNSSARVLTVAFWVVSLYYVARTIVFVGGGPTGVVFTTWFGTVTTTIVTVILVIISAISLSVIQAGRLAPDLPGQHPESGTLPGVLTAAEFDACAEDWLRRGRRDRDAMVWVLIEVDNLEHINTAYGREHGDQVIREVARITRTAAPSAALIGRLGSRRFAVLTPAPGVGSAIGVAERLHTALVETPIPQIDSLRAVATCGLATTDREGHSIARLRAAAEEALAIAGGRGPGSIHLAGTVAR